MKGLGARQKKKQKSKVVLSETHNEGEDEWRGFQPFIGGDTEGYGGVIIQARKNLYAERLYPGKEGECQTVWIGIHGPDVKLAICGVYIPPANRNRKIGQVRQEFLALQRQQTQLTEEGWEILVMGDLNAHLEQEKVGGDGANPNAAGDCLKKWVEEENLHIANYSHICDGRWSRVTSNKKSMPDYIISTEAILDNMERMEIDEHKIFGIDSDHNWLLCDIAVGTRRRMNSRRKKIWNLRNANWEVFEQAMQEGLKDWLEVPWERTEDETRVDTMAELLTECFEAVGEEIIGTKWIGGFRKVQEDKPAKEKVNKRRAANRAFREAKRQRDRLATSGASVTAAQAEVDRTENLYEQRREEVKEFWLNRWKNEMGEKLDTFKADKSGRTFWKWAKRIISKAEQGVGLRLDNGSRIFQKNEIKEELERYYYTLCNREESKNTPRFLPDVTDVEDIREREERDEVLMAPITEDEVKSAIRNLKKTKSLDADKIPNEFFKHCGPDGIKALTILYNQCTEEHAFPKIWKRGRTVFLPKPGSDGSLNTMRGITMNSSMGKILVKIIWERLYLDAETRKIFGLMQHGFRKNYQTMDAIFALTQALDKRKRKKRATAMAFLDIKKAYDWVDRELLWGAMEKQGYGVGVTGFIKEMYRDITTRVEMDGVVTDEIPISAGLKQGCPLSPFLFSLYIQELCDKLEQSGEGLTIGPDGRKTRMPGLLFADDIVLMAETEDGLQRLLDIVAQFAKDRKMVINPVKSKILVNWRAVNKKNRWRIGEHIIHEGLRRKVTVVLEEEEGYKYLGVWIQLRGRIFEDYGKKATSKAGRYVGIVKNVWRCSKQSAWVAVKLWNAVAKPAILYGSEVATLTQKEELEIERKQRIMARFIVKGRKNCAIAAMYGELGWRDLSYDMDMRKLRYCGRLWSKSTPNDRWAKMAFDEGLEDLSLGRGISSWWNKIAKLVVKYGIDLTKVNTPEWKKHVDKKIGERALLDWRQQVEERETMRYYRIKDEPSFDSYLANNWKYRFQIFAIKTGQGTLNWMRQKWEAGNDGKCAMCGLEEETEEHLIIRCRKLNNLRDNVLEILLGGLSQEGWETFQQMDDTEKMGVVTAVHPAVRKELRTNQIRRIEELVGQMLTKRHIQAERWTTR